MARSGVVLAAAPCGSGYSTPTHCGPLGTDGYGLPPAHVQSFHSPPAPAAAAVGLHPSPSSLTVGLPDPVAVERQKSGYMKTLDDQERQSQANLEIERQQRLEYMRIQAEQLKKQLLVQIEQKVKTQEMALTRQYNEQLLQLNQQYHAQKAHLEQQAVQLTMQFQQKCMQESMMQKQLELEQEQCEVQHRFQLEIQRLQSEAQAKPPPVGPLGAFMPPASGSYVPPAMAVAAHVSSYTPQAPNPYGTAPAPYGMVSQGSFQMHTGANVLQPSMSSFSTSGCTGSTAASAAPLPGVGASPPPLLEPVGTGYSMAPSYA